MERALYRAYNERASAGFDNIVSRAFELVIDDGD